MLKIKQFAFNPFGESTYIVWDDTTRDAMVVDPGMADSREQAIFDKYIEDHKLHLKQIVNTHLHVDHCIGDNYIANKYGAKIAAGAADAPLGAAVAEQARMFGVAVGDAKSVVADINLKDGDIIKVGVYDFVVLEVPGHSPGGIALYCARGKLAIVGDSIFRMSIGRTDLPGGDHDTLIRSLHDKILSLPDDTALLPGHDRATTVAFEKANNPYLQ